MCSYSQEMFTLLLDEGGGCHFFFFFFCLWPNVFWLGKIEGRRRGGWQRMRWLDSIIDLTDMSLTLGDEF